MPDNADPTDKGNTAAAIDIAAMQKMIDESIGKALSARLPRVKGTEETIAKMVADAIAKISPTDKPAEPAVSNPADSEQKLTLKALNDQLANLNKGIQERDRKLQEAEQRTREIRVRSEVSSHFARHLGADSPHIAPYVNHFLGQFTDQDGNTMRKVKNEFGEDQFVPANAAIDELFKGDLKHLVNTSKAQNLPRSQSFLQSAGNPFAPQQGQGAQSDVNPILGEFARHFAQHGDVNRANAILQAQPDPASKK